ncbi:MAG: hypothetical protein AAGG68_01330 [Bacteroidota bacterium]
MKKIISTSLKLWFALTLVTACSSDKENLLLGNWKATQLTENGEAISMDLREVQFTFDEQGRYQFQSTLNYREAGFYRQNNNLLYTTDTLNSKKEQQAVKILKLDEEVLELGMEDNGKKLVLLLEKVGIQE